MSGFHAARRQAGGGNASASGTTGSGAHSIVVISARGSRWRWRAVRTTLASTCWVSAPRRVRLPPHTLRVTTAGRMACSARQLVASIDGSHKKRNTAGVDQRRRGVDQPAEPGGESAAGRRQTVLTDFARVRAGPQGEAVLQDRLHRARPGAVGMSCLQVLASSQEVSQARLVRRLLEAAIGHPPVPHQHAGEVGAENRRRIVEPAAVADGVDRRLRGGEHPQPAAECVHPPARLIRRDHRTAADLLAQRRIRGRRRVGGAVQQSDQAALGHVQSELGPQNADDLLQRHAQLGVQLDDQRGDVRTQLGGSRAQRVGGLQGVPALHAPLALRAVAHLDVEAPHEGMHRRQVFLVLRRHTVQRDRAAAVRTARRGRRHVCLVSLRRLPAAPLPSVLRPGSPPGTPAASLRPVLGEGSRLSAAGAPRRLELLLQMLATALPVIPILDQLRLVSFEAFDAPHVPRVPLTPRSARVVAVVLLARHTSRIGTRPPHLHTFSWIFSPRPANRRRSQFLRQRLVAAGVGVNQRDVAE